MKLTIGGRGWFVRVEPVLRLALASLRAGLSHVGPALAYGADDMRSPLVFLSFVCTAGLLACSSAPPSDAPDSGVVAIADSGAVAPDVGIDAGFEAPDAGFEAPDAGFFPDARVDRPLAPTWAAVGALPPVNGSNVPMDRWASAVIEIPEEHRFFVFGGNTAPAGPTTNDLFFYSVDDQTWTQVMADPMPPPRFCHCGAYIPELRTVFIEGGRDDRDALTPNGWLFSLDTMSWERVMGGAPAGVVGCNAVWMPSFPGGGRVIMFGGDSRSGLKDETWSYNPATKQFEFLQPAHTPPSRRDTHLMYDPGENGQGRVLMWSGSSVVFPANRAMQRDDLWAFDGTDWTEIPMPAAHPAARRYGGSAFDVSRREWIVFGGTKETSDFGDLWRFDAARNTWEELTAMGSGGGDLPHARGFPLFGYDVASEQYLLFGGYTQPAYTDVRAGWSLRLRP